MHTGIDPLTNKSIEASFFFKLKKLRRRRFHGGR